MIVRPPLHWLRLFFVWHGSVLGKVLGRLLLNFGMAVVAVWLMPQIKMYGLHLSTAPFSLIGIALAIFMGFRNSVSFERFWEGRKLWGGVLIASRALLRQAQTLSAQAPDSPAIRQLAELLIAFGLALKHQLRRSDLAPDMARWLPPALAARISTAQFPCVLLLREMGRWVAQQQRAGHITELGAMALNRLIDDLTASHGGCERIASTPIPYAYSVLLHRTVYVYCTLLPFSLTEAAGLLTPLISAFISYAFIALDAIASELEEPFGTEPNDLPLGALCVALERTLLEQCDAPDLPPAAQPDRYHVLD
jgi:putative membrane protein